MPGPTGPCVSAEKHTRRSASRRLLPAFVVGATLALPVCGSVVLSTGTSTAAEVATAAEDALERQVRPRPDITCPEALNEEDGASTRCTLTGGDDPVDGGSSGGGSDVDVYS